MLRIAGACLIMASAAGIGISFSADLKRRCRDLRILKQLVCMLRGEIKYTRSPLPEAFLHISERIAEPFSGFLSQTVEEMRKADGRVFGDLWREQIALGLKASCLSRSDREQLATLGEVLGYLDLEMQLSAIDLYLEQLELAIREAQENTGSRQKLYRSLGIAGGAFLVLLLI